MQVRCDYEQVVFIIINDVLSIFNLEREIDRIMEFPDSSFNLHILKWNVARKQYITVVDYQAFCHVTIGLPRMHLMLISTSFTVSDILIDDAPGIPPYTTAGVYFLIDADIGPRIMVSVINISWFFSRTNSNPQQVTL